jgi:phosphoribosylformimino-5-aminoimidazole carboxamide ribotide isomerase
VILYPAIDIQGGKAVRLRRGDFSRATVFGDDPVVVARRWADEGAEVLHVVDLDGAREGRLVNIGIVERIAAAIEVPVEFGGGVRDREALARAAASGEHWVVVGTSAVTDGDLLAAAVDLLGERLVVGADCSGGRVATHGWQEASDMTAVEFARRLEEVGARRILYTDVARDGMLAGPDVEGLRELAVATSLEVIMSGGVGTLDDLVAIRAAALPNVIGTIVGRALYDGRFTLAEAAAALA